MVNKLLNALCPCNRTARSRTRFYFRFSLNNYIRDEIAEYYYFKSKYTHEERLYEPRLPNSSMSLLSSRDFVWTGACTKTKRPHFPAATTIHKGVHLGVPPGGGADRRNIGCQHLVTTPAILGLLSASPDQRGPFHYPYCRMRNLRADKPQLIQAQQLLPSTPHTLAF